MLPSLCTAEQCYRHCTHIYLGPTQLLDKQTANFHNSLSDNVGVITRHGTLDCSVLTHCGAALWSFYTLTDKSIAPAQHTLGQYCYYYTLRDNISFITHSGTIVLWCHHVRLLDSFVVITYGGAMLSSLHIVNNMSSSLHNVGHYVVIFTYIG